MNLAFIIIQSTLTDQLNALIQILYRHIRPKNTFIIVDPRRFQHICSEIHQMPGSLKMLIIRPSTSKTVVRGHLTHKEIRRGIIRAQ